ARRALACRPPSALWPCHALLLKAGAACQPPAHSYNRPLSRAKALLRLDSIMPAGKRPVAIIMGSKSDWATMPHAADTPKSLRVVFDARVVSAHRTPDRLYEFAKGARGEGFKIVIAGAGGAAHLPGMTASLTPLPVFGVPVK